MTKLSCLRKYQIIPYYWLVSIAEILVRSEREESARAVVLKLE